MRDWSWKPKLGSAELEALLISRLEFFRQLFCSLTKHPAAPSLRSVDLSTTILCKHNFPLVDSLERFWTAPQPYRIREIRCVMIMMVVGDGYDLCLVCCVLDPFPGLISCSEFSWMRHQSEPRAQRDPCVQ